jgi:hypothetical protein
LCEGLGVSFVFEPVKAFLKFMVGNEISQRAYHPNKFASFSARKFAVSSRDVATPDFPFTVSNRA